MKINPGDISSDEFEKAKELTKLYHQMEDGEITEDEYNLVNSLAFSNSSLLISPGLIFIVFLQLAS